VRGERDDPNRWRVSLLGKFQRTNRSQKGGRHEEEHPRIKSTAFAGFDKRLAAYAAAAATACCGLLGGPTTAEATIVYVPNANIRLGNGAIDLNGDGTVDLNFLQATRRFPTGMQVSLYGYQNGIGAPPFTGITKPLQFGANIGPGESFQRNSFMALALVNCTRNLYQCHDLQGGNWDINGSAYMGIDFAIDGQPHFGWAKAQVFVGFHGASADISGMIMSYAYETTPDVGLYAGQGAPEPGTLTLLALGALGVETLRRRRRQMEARAEARLDS
jgi:PEP-CTERM motif